MTPAEELVAAIREARFALNRVTGQDLAETRPAVRQALEAQAKGLQADVERLLGEMATIAQGEAYERDLIS